MSQAIISRLNNMNKLAHVSFKEVAQLLDSTPETVSRWRTGKTEPHPHRRDYLLKLEWLISELSELYSPDEARLWLFSPHKMLGGDRPADRIHNGHIEDVLAIIAQLKDGAYV